MSLYFTLSLLPQKSHDTSLPEILDNSKSCALRNSLKSYLRNYSHVIQGSDINIELEHEVLARSNFLIQNKLLREPTKVPGKRSVSHKTARWRIQV